MEEGEGKVLKGRGEGREEGKESGRKESMKWRTGKGRARAEREAIPIIIWVIIRVHEHAKDRIEVLGGLVHALVVELVIFVLHVVLGIIWHLRVCGQGFAGINCINRY